MAKMKQRIDAELASVVKEKLITMVSEPVEKRIQCTTCGYEKTTELPMIVTEQETICSACLFKLLERVKDIMVHKFITTCTYQKWMRNELNQP